jgi:hypothetical protein
MSGIATLHRGYLPAALGRVSWRAIGISLALGYSLGALRFLQNFQRAPRNFLVSGLVITSISAIAVMLATFGSDEAVRRGAPPWSTYAAALVAASFISAYGQFYVRGFLHLYTAVNQPGMPAAVQRTQMIFVGCDCILFGGLAMFAYINRRTAQSILAGVRRAELKRVQLERRIAESSLAAARARIDPMVLSNDLAEIRTLYLTGASNAELKLDALIHRLHATVRTGGLMIDARKSP